MVFAVGRCIRPFCDLPHCRDVYIPPDDTRQAHDALEIRLRVILPGPRAHRRAQATLGAMRFEATICYSYFRIRQDMASGSKTK
jgi:hypothetical protein